MKQIHSPAEMLQIARDIGIQKSQKTPHRTRALAFMAGMFIAIGASASVKILTVMHDNPLQYFLSALVFTIGIVSVILAGGELFTGNILLVEAYLSRAISLRAMLVNWCRVYFWNFIGSIFFAVLTYWTSRETAFSDTVHLIGSAKVLDLGFLQAFILGVLCNILVCLSVWTSYAAPDALGKFFLSAFPVLIFVLLKYEHSVANMFYIPYAMMVDGSLPIGRAFLMNVLPVTLGNIAGGAIIAAAYHAACHPDKA